MRWVRVGAAPLVAASLLIGTLASSSTPALAARNPCKAVEKSYEVAGYSTDGLWATVRVRNRSKSGQVAQLSFEVVDRKNKAKYVYTPNAFMGYVPPKSQRTINGFVGDFPQSYSKNYQIRLKVRCAETKKIPLLPVKALFVQESPDDFALWNYTVVNTTRKWISKWNPVQISFHDPSSGKLVGGCSAVLDYDLPPGSEVTNSVSCNSRGASNLEWSFSGIPESQVTAKATIAVSQGTTAIDYH